MTKGDKQAWVLSQNAVNHRIRSSLLEYFLVFLFSHKNNCVCFFCFFCPNHKIIFSFSVSLVDDGCKSNNQAKREKKRPPGTVEFSVSKTSNNAFK